MLRLLKPRAGGFAANGAGVAALEFALIAPFLFMLLLAGFDLGRFVLATQRVERVAGSVAQMLAETPTTTSQSLTNYANNPQSAGIVSANDLLFYWNSAMFTFPDVLAVANAQGANWWNLLDVQMASIAFIPNSTTCSPNCVYTPKVMWSLGSRACGSAITAVSDTTYYSPTTLPADIFGSGSMIVVDVTYTWTPTIGAAYLGSIPIERSVYLAPRNPVVVIAQPNNGVANPCP